MKHTMIVLEGGECTYKSTIAKMLADKYSGVLHKRQRIPDRFELLRSVMNDISNHAYRTRVLLDERLHIFDRWELISDIVYEKYQYGEESVLESLMPLFSAEIEKMNILVIFLDVNKEDLTERFNSRGDELIDLAGAMATNYAYVEFFKTESSPKHKYIDTSGRTSADVFEGICNILEGEM